MNTSPKQQSHHIVPKKMLVKPKMFAQRAKMRQAARLLQDKFSPMARSSSSKSSPGTLALQSQLERLPLPSLKETLPKLLRTVRPHVTEEEYEETFSKVKELASEGGQGHMLQALLEERAATRENWFSDWWLDLAYLGYRDPVVVWSSPGVPWPRQNFPDTTSMIRFAARVAAGALDFKISIDQQSIPVDMQGVQPLDMQQYFKLFGTNRLPEKPLDRQSFNAHSKHIVVIVRNQFFKLQVYGEAGELLSVDQIQTALEQILSLASSEPGPGLGILTSNSRDDWAVDFSLLASNKKNKASLAVLESALFTLSLDSDYEDLLAEDDLSRTALAALHGLGSRGAGANRWHDKTIQLFVSRSGECGMTYEHSPAEGPPLMVITDHILDFVDGKARIGSNLPAINLEPVEPLEFVVTDEIRRAVGVAGEKLDRLVEDLDLSVLHFENFGKSEIKKLGLSPDSFIQMAIQLAFYRQQGQPGAHYESSGTRRFLHGRTEVIRSCSIESVAFSRSMMPDSSSSSEERIGLMKAAILGHNNYGRMAAAGLGVDRHLQGMKLMALEKGLELPTLFSDPGYIKSGRMRLSTSQVGGRSASFLCFGPLVSDGYGICYNPRAQDMFLPVSSLASSTDTNTTDFRTSLQQSLLDMIELARDNMDKTDV